MKITFLGGGNMAAALIGGLIERGFAPAAVQVIELGAALRTQLVNVSACARWRRRMPRRWRAMCWCWR